LAGELGLHGPRAYQKRLVNIKLNNVKATRSDLTPYQDFTTTAISLTEF